LVFQFGWSVSLAGDGTRLAVGADYNDGNGVDSGHVRVFDIAPLCLSEIPTKKPTSAPSNTPTENRETPSPGTRPTVSPTKIPDERPQTPTVTTLVPSLNPTSAPTSQLEEEKLEQAIFLGISISFVGVDEEISEQDTFFI